MTLALVVPLPAFIFQLPPTIGTRARRRAVWRNIVTFFFVWLKGSR